MGKKYSSLNIEFFSPKFYESIKFEPVKVVKVTVTASNIGDEEKSVYIENVFPNDKFNITFDKILCGKNRIVSVEFFYAENFKIERFSKRKLINIEENENFCKIDYSETAFATVLDGIKNIYDLDELEADGRLSVIKNVIDFEIPHYLFDSNKLISELKGFSFPYNCSKEDYKIFTNELKFFVDSDILVNSIVFVKDFLSDTLKITEKGEYTIQNIVCGTYEFAISNPKFDEIKYFDVTIGSDKVLNLGNLLENIKEKDLKKNLEFLPTDKDFKRCFSVDEKNQEFIVLLNEKFCEEKFKSVKAFFNSGINDHDGNYSGPHKDLFYDNRGFWFCKVGFFEIPATNQSGQISYNFKTDKKIISYLPDFVDSGYIYQKFNETQPEKKFLVLIYPFQNEEKICSALKNAKKVKLLKDFDLKTEEGLKQISNFRKVPGTKKLFRSFHPFKDDKKQISNTSFERMSALEKLCEKYKISADINLSDNELQQPTYKMPEFYKKIIESQKILYLTQTNYSVCYENTDSLVFADGIKKIIQFVNNTDEIYLIHCAIGTDRTGIICAVLALLCGADFKSVENDYCSSINMGILEYRGIGCVRYSIQKFLQLEKFDEKLKFDELIKNRLIKLNVLKKSEIEKFIKKI